MLVIFVEYAYLTVHEELRKSLLLSKVFLMFSKICFHIFLAAFLFIEYLPDISFLPLFVFLFSSKKLFQIHLSFLHFLL